MSSKLGKIVADFRTSLATKISVGGTTASLQSNLDDDGIALPDGTYFFTIDGDSSQKEHIVATNTGGNLTDIKSISRQGVQTAGVKREHRVGAAVTITDFAHIKYLNDLLDGTTDLDGSKPLKYDIDPTISDDKHLATKKYVGDAFSGVVGTASSTVSGTTKLSSDPVTPNNPVALNSEEVSATSGANKVPKANANGLIDSGFIIDNAADSGLEEGANGGTKVKVKTAGGILIDADGLSVDTTVYPATPTMPAYENLVAGDLLKTINDGGTYKLKKIYGIQNPLTGSAPSQVKEASFLRAYEISTDKILITYAKSSYGTGNVYAIIGNISGSTITFDGNTKVTTENNVINYGAASCMVNTNKVLVVGSYGSDTYARICSVSNNTISVSSALQLWSDNSRLSDSVTISTDKAVVQYYLNDQTKIVAIDTSGATPTMGAAVEVYNTAVVGPHTTYKIANNKTISIYCKSSDYTTYGVIGTISGTNITTGSAQAISQIGHTSNNYLSSCNIIYVSDDYSVIAWTESGSGNTYYGIITVSGTTFSLNAITPLSIGTNACLVDRFLYVSEYPNTKHKVTFNSSGQFNLVTTVNLNGSLVPRLNNTILLSVNGFETTRLMLLDHDEFITSANKSYVAGDSVPITNVFTGFSGLTVGVDYYINSTGNGITINNTYQKIGKAINDTTIIKS